MTPMGMMPAHMAMGMNGGPMMGGMGFGGMEEMGPMMAGPVGMGMVSSALAMVWRFGTSPECLDLHQNCFAHWHAAQLCCCSSTGLAYLGSSCCLCPSSQYKGTAARPTESVGMIWRDSG